MKLENKKSESTQEFFPLKTSCELSYLVTPLFFNELLPLETLEYQQFVNKIHFEIENRHFSIKHKRSGE